MRKHTFLTLTPARAGVRKHIFLIVPRLAGVTLSAWTLWTLSACSSANFAVTGSEPPEDAGTDGEEVKLAVQEDGGFIEKVVKDSGTSEQDSPTHYCEPNSCKAGCGGCDSDAGMVCGTAGPSLCGSQNCMQYLASNDAGFPCTSSASLPTLVRCGGSGADTVPGCVYSGTYQNYRWYCCRG